MSLIPEYEEWLGIAHSLVDGEYPARGSYEMKLARCVVSLEKQVETAREESDAKTVEWHRLVEDYRRCQEQLESAQHGLVMRTAQADALRRVVESAQEWRECYRDWTATGDSRYHVCRHARENLGRLTCVEKLYASLDAYACTTKQPGDSNIGFGVVIDE